MGIVLNMFLTCIVISLYISSRGPVESRKEQIAQYRIPNPNITMTSDGVLGPWKMQYGYGYPFSLVYLHDVFVTRDGVYEVRVQVAFKDSIEPKLVKMLKLRDGSRKRIAICGQPSGNISIPVTCYTQVITTLLRGDRISVEILSVNDAIDIYGTYLGIKNIYYTNHEKKNIVN